MLFDLLWGGSVLTSPDGFRLLSSGNDRASGTYSTLLADVAIQVSGILAAQFSSHGIDPRTAPLYAQMLVGIVAMPSQWWLENRTLYPGGKRQRRVGGTEATEDRTMETPLIRLDLEKGLLHWVA